MFVEQVYDFLHFVRKEAHYTLFQFFRYAPDCFRYTTDDSTQGISISAKAYCFPDSIFKSLALVDDP